jgi:DUF1009 family protein
MNQESPESLCGESKLSLSSPLGLVAGNGIFPLEFARSARQRGLKVIAVAHIGETSPEIESLVSHCVWIRVGQLGQIIKTFKKHGVGQAAFAGGISRVRLFGGVKLDLKAVALIARLRSVKDDIILRGIAEEVEKGGVKVFSASLLLDRSLPAPGYLTRKTLTRSELEQAVIGWETAKITGALDIGQTVVVGGGVVVAIEAIEGTDATIKRGAELSCGDCVIVKVCKPQQDLRLDLPTIGRNTLDTMRLCGISSLVIEADKTIILEPDETVRAADSAGIAILAVNSSKYIQSLI